jgi:hypothetical protein
MQDKRMPLVTIAHKTLTQINEMIRVDQGAKFRGFLGRVLPHIGDAYRQDEDGHRSHLGASQLGAECPRAIWYGFRWTTKADFPGRIIRLFNRGHLEEGRFIALLLMLGCEVYQQDSQGKQFRISFAEGHAGGSGDGVALRIPDLPVATACLLEFKTHGEKSFIELAGNLTDWRMHIADPTKNPFPGKGVREAKFEHYVQIQLYMRKMGLAVALYMAVNKNTDDLYGELVPLDSGVADQFLDRGEKLVWMKEPPAKLNPSPGFFKCRFCDHKPVCHMKGEPDFNCRTCGHSEPREAATWYCNQKNCMLSKEMQQAGCAQYKKNEIYK